MEDISLDDLNQVIRTAIRAELSQWNTAVDAKFALLQAHINERFKNTEYLIVSLEQDIEERFTEVLASIGAVTESILDTAQSHSAELSNHKKRIETLEIRCG